MRIFSGKNGGDSSASAFGEISEDFRDDSFRIQIDRRQFRKLTGWMTDRDFRQIVADGRRVCQRIGNGCKKESGKKTVFDSIEESAVILGVFGETEDKETVDVNLLLLRHLFKSLDENLRKHAFQFSRTVQDDSVSGEMRLPETDPCADPFFRAQDFVVDQDLERALHG